MISQTAKGILKPVKCSDCRRFDLPCMIECSPEKILYSPDLLHFCLQFKSKKHH